MKGDIPIAALRLMAQGRVHTHTQQRGPERGEARRIWLPKPKVRTKPAKVINGRGRGGANKRAIVIDGTTFKSMTLARAHYRVGRKTINTWLRTGKAKIVEIAKIDPLA